MEFSKFKNSQTINNMNNNDFVEELKLTLKVKENLIETINDNLILKDAEIARLKTRICLYERNMK
jgi:hypothetical protein